MAIDLLIFGLLLVSFVINLLALGAFWVTPGLRTTANRFTINLLIINLIGCLILAPTLFISASGYTDTAAIAASATTTVDDDSIEFYSKPGNHQMTIRHNGQLVEQEGVILRRNASHSAGASGPAETRTIETIFKCNTTYCQELTIDEGSETIVITEIEEDNRPSHDDSQLPSPPPSLRPQLIIADGNTPAITMRAWSIDMAAALGALAVLLVVGDTWCAVTDPLRYHSRVSGVKSWIFIALTWVVGVLFGSLSAFRELSFESDTFVGKQRRFVETYLHLSTTSGVFGLAFACLYFVVIILLPFGFVCGMYWRIFSEARENGLRMRQNGSSPLLQSALNLTHHQHANQNPLQSSSPGLQYANNLCVHRTSISSASSQGGGGLHMQIDQQQQQPLPLPTPTQRKASPACLRRDSAAKVLLPTISDDGCSDDVDADADSIMGGQLVPVAEVPDRNQNILLTLQTASGEIKRNYSARQLPLLGTSSQDLREAHRLQGIRQVHSSPNLHKYTQVRQDSLSDEGGSPHLLGHSHPHPAAFGHVQHRLYIQAPHHHHHNNSHIHHAHALQIPAIHASPKALSYMSSLRHRLSNASSLFKYREESRAARISILVVIMFLVSYLPYGFLVLLQSRLSAANFPHSTQLAIVMILLANLSSPFIFAYRNKRVRRGVKRLFGVDARCRTLLRQNSSSGRCSGFLRRQMGHAQDASAHIKRNGSRVSTYSSNSGKYLTPQSSLVSNVGPPLSSCCRVPVHRGANGAGAPPPLRHNSSCCTIINFAISSEVPPPPPPTPAPAPAATLTTTTTRPKLQRGITIVEQIPVGSKFDTRRSIFQMFFHGSKSLGCAPAGDAPTAV